MNSTELESGKAELGRLTAVFFRAVSFEEGATPPCEDIHAVFIEAGLLIQNSGAAPGNSTRFILTPLGWKISAMAWDDERPGLRIPEPG